MSTYFLNPCLEYNPQSDVIKHGAEEINSMEESTDLDMITPESRMCRIL